MAGPQTVVIRILPRSRTLARFGCLRRSVQSRSFARSGLGEVGAAIRSRQLWKTHPWRTFRRVFESASSLHSHGGGLLGFSVALVFSTWRDADPSRTFEDAWGAFTAMSRSADVSWALTRRETVRPWEPRAQPSRFQKPPDPLPVWVHPPCGACALAGFNPRPRAAVLPLR